MSKVDARWLDQFNPVTVAVIPRWRLSDGLPGSDQGFLHLPAWGRAPFDGSVPILQPSDGEFGTRRPRSPLWPGIRAFLGRRLWVGLRRWWLGGRLRDAPRLGRQLRTAADPTGDRGLPAVRAAQSTLGLVSRSGLGGGLGGGVAANVDHALPAHHALELAHDDGPDRQRWRPDVPFAHELRR